MSKSMCEKIHTFGTELGWMALVGAGSVLRGLAFGHASAETAAAAVRSGIKRTRHTTSSAAAQVSDDILSEEADSPSFLHELAERLARFAAGEAQDFSDVALDVCDLTPFSQHVLMACRSIQWGQTVTYSELARRCGSPGAARAVGNVLARNRYPLIVPCHRVLPADGRLGGFSAPQGTKMKKRLLALERAQRN